MNPNNLTRGTRLKIIVFSLVLAMAAAFGSLQALAAPPAPGWLPGQPLLAGNQVIAMWLPVPGAVKYIVYLDDKKIAESPANQYMGPAPEGAGEFRYQVVAVDATGAESPKSLAGIIRITKIVPPQELSFRANNRDMSVQIRWDSPPGAVIYNIFRAEAKDGPFELLASVQDTTYKDSGLEGGKEYWYSVSAKDVTGKESEKSTPTPLTIETRVAGRTQDTFELTIVPSNEVRRITMLNPETFVEVPRAARLRFNPSRTQLYLLDRTDIVRVLNPQMLQVRSFTVSLEGRAECKLFNITFIDDDTAYMCDLNNFLILEVDLNSGAVLNSIKPRKPTMQEAPEILESMSERFRTLPVQPLAVALLDDGTLWVSDGYGGIIVVVDEDGESLEWYKDFKVDGNEKQLAALPDMFTLENGDILTSTGMGRTVMRLDPETREAKWEAGQAATMVGNFIGYGGMTVSPDGTMVLVTDPTMHTMQVFDINTGKYLFSVGSSQKKPDPAQPTRAHIDFSNPAHPIFLDENQLSIYLAQDVAFSVREFTEPLPASGGE